MKVLIVEDETAAYDSIVDILREIDPTIKIAANTESVSQTVNWLKANETPDLILMDIHLSDGSAFLIFNYIKVEVPIIFTTAYDEYAIEAFRVNSIDYLLKPIKTHELQRGLAKFGRLTNSEKIDYITRASELKAPKKYRDLLLIPLADQLLPVEVVDIGFIYTSDKNTQVGLKDGRQFTYSSTLDQLASCLNPNNFYRANKQFIVARNNVKKITIWHDNRLLLTLDTVVPEPVYVSKNKASDFKNWMVNG